MTTTKLTPRAASAPALGLLVLGGALLAAPASAQPAFDFDNGHAPIEVVIPSAVPAIFASVGPGDATLVLRFTTLITNAWFDATAPYHPTAVGVYSRLGRRPASESTTNANINIAILYASYRALNSLFPAFGQNWRDMMTSVGLDPDDDHESTTDPVGIGNAAANAMLAIREQDGMNQLGDEGGRRYNLAPYADYTGYKPVNTAYDLKNPSRWQPARTTSPYGISRVQHFVTPQYAQVLPYSYHPDFEIDVPPPEKSMWKGKHKKDYRAQADEVLAKSASLTDEEKMKAEHFDNKIVSLGFSTVFASFARGLSVIEFVQYDFLVNVAAFDTGIQTWRAKAKYDAVRPFSAIAFLYGDDEVTAWGGPGQGTVNDLPANQWRSYLNVADHSEYPSGSASFCAAHTQASRLYFGDDNLGWSVPAPAGSSVHEPGVTPASDIVMHWDTWSEFNEDCGDSRFWGGVHFKDSIVEGRVIGNTVADKAYAFVSAHIDGTAPEFTPPVSSGGGHGSCHDDD